MKKLEIKGISNNYIPLQDLRTSQPAAQAENEKKSDKLEISSEARILQAQNGKSTKDLALIQQRIKDNFYNSDEVINSTASAILKEFKIK